MVNSDLIIEESGKIVGTDNVALLSDIAAAPYRRILGENSAVIERLVAAVRPDSTEQIQDLVRLAGTRDIHVLTIPNTAGNGAALLGNDKHGLVLDLSRMDEIIEFNPDSGYALVEPGVSFDMLREHINKKGASHWVDSDKNGANSISGSINERAFGYTPYGDHLLMQCGMEVVTADGEVMRTGMGALPNSDTWQLFKYNYGPYLDGLFSRSDLAVLTKVGVWLMPTPPAYHPFMVALPDVSALESAIEVLRPLKISMVVPNTVVISERRADSDLVRSSNVEDIGDGKRSEWNLYGALYGIPDNVKITWQMLENALAKIPNGTISTIADPPKDPAWPLRTRLMRGEPVYSKTAEILDRKLWFAAAAPMEGGAATAMRDIVQKSLVRSNVDFIYEYALTWRTMFMRVSIDYTEETLATHTAVALSAIADLTAAGYSISHDSRELTAAVSTAHTGSSLRKLYRSINEALDPNRTLTGGWPAA